MLFIVSIVEGYGGSRGPEEIFFQLYFNNNSILLECFHVLVGVWKKFGGDPYFVAYGHPEELYVSFWGDVHIHFHVVSVSMVKTSNFKLFVF